ncbi:recombinase family protein [Streptomyces sp. HC307]|uniref:recombinase family protein n=1 Tax=Streptomyces flavusporus TaxID=3385496 RepID=UPI003916D0B1
MTDPRKPSASDRSDADDVERHACPKCDAQPGSPCRSRGGAVASAHHARRFTMVARLKKALRVPTPADRGPGRPWRPGTPPPAPIDPHLPSADIRIGYARCSTLGQELGSQLDALSKHGIPRDKIFSEKISTRDAGPPPVRGGAGDQGARPALPGDLHCVRDETARPRRRRMFAFFAAMAETARENIRESTLEGLDTAARKGKRGGRPPVITDDMLHTVLRRRANGESVEQIQPDLIIPTGKRKGQNPSVASTYRALAEHAKRDAYPEAVEAAHTDFAALQSGDLPSRRAGGPHQPAQ